MTNVTLEPISSIRWSLHARLLPAYCYQQILTTLYFIHAFLPHKVQQFGMMASDGGNTAFQTIVLPLWSHTIVKTLTVLAMLPLLSFFSFIALTTLAFLWPLLVVGSTATVISFTGALLMLNQVSHSPIRQFAMYLLTLIPLACLGYVFAPFLWCTLFLITAYHSITNPHFASMPSLSTAGSRWLGLACGFLLITAPYWTVWHIITFPLMFFLSWMAQFWAFVGFVLVSKVAPNLVDSVNNNYSAFVGKHSRPVTVEKDHTIIEKTINSGNGTTGKETYERLQKIEHHN